jgi:hypothetical protein
MIPTEERKEFKDFSEILKPPPREEKKVPQLI